MDTTRYLTVQASSELLDREGKLIYAYLNTGEQWQFHRPLAEISPYLVNATIAVEDQRFWSHHGVDPIAIARAATQNIRKARVHSGASTITMQVVKQSDSGSRSPVDKARQAWQALRLELRAEKSTILETYLNSAPYGLNLIGCESASRRYFGKPSSELTLGEAALLAGLPKSPVGYMPLRYPKAARQRRTQVLDRMRDKGFISAGDYTRANAEPVGASWHDYPQLAPHLAMRLASTLPPARRTVTTVDAALQSNAEQLLTESLKQFDNDVTNAAAIVIDVPTARVLARVGSTNFYNTPGGGQVDATRAPRSPGSALKPFTYALALDQNLLYASEMLLDDSLDYGLYNPENYDGKYRGVVSASYALRRSLNVPSVIVLERLGYANMHRFLLTSGLTTLAKPPEYYGLGLTLGNCEVRLDQLGAAYCMIANLGEYRPLTEFDSPLPAPRRLLSRGACLSLYEMLEQEFPEEFQRDIVSAQGYKPRVCWKTGTSTGNHDAWSFVFNRHYVVGVWLGNNDGRGSKFLVGARAALPLAERLFRSLPKTSEPDWPGGINDMRVATVCADSGLPASQFCAHKSSVRVAVDQFLNRRCDVHYPQTALTSGIMQRWPATAHGWDLARVDVPINLHPDQNTRKTGLRILTPANSSEFVMTYEANADRLRVRASADGAMDINWYLDGHYLGASGPGKNLFLNLTEGAHTLTCMGPGGETDSVSFIVAAPTNTPHFKTASR